MIKRVLTKLKIQSVLFVASACITTMTFAQSVPYPAPSLDQSMIPPSPNAQGFQVYGNTSVALSEGLPNIGIPIYEVKCGSLSVPISLSYYYSGLQPLQDASWVGLGWNLNAGGVITRIPEGNIDGIGYTGYNYGEYSIVDSLQPANNTFLGLAYNNYQSNSYDLALDVFDCEFNGISGKFFWNNGKAYILSYDKDLGISWPSPSSNFTVTTKDGVTCTFAAKESTMSNQSWQGHKIIRNFTSAWFLTSMISADKKDTVLFNYANYSWQQAEVPTTYSYVMSTSVGQSDLGFSNDFVTTPTIQTKILQSITCRNVTVNFIPDAALRTDVLGSSPKLKEIDVIDNISSAVIKKNVFTYENFGGGTDTTASGRWLKLRKFQTVNPGNASDVQTYTFKYYSESGFSSKGTTGTDYWGFYNGYDGNVEGMPAPALGFYYPAPPQSWTAPVANKTPTDACMAGSLDTLFYPTGGFSVFKYEHNTYSDGYGTMNLGPGIRINSILDFTNLKDTPVMQKFYTYLKDDGKSSSGRLSNYLNFTGPSFSANSNNYTAYIAANASSGLGGLNPGFYYTKVTESAAAAGDIHKTDYYFNNYSSSLFADVRLGTQINYLFSPADGSYRRERVVVNTYAGSTDTSFLFGTAFMQSYTYQPNSNQPIPIYTYGFTSSSAQAHWVRLDSTLVKQYDVAGDSMTTSTKYNYDGARNLSSMQEYLSDGNSIIKMYKYPENYTSAITGSMVTNRVLSPVIEQQTWFKSPGSPGQSSLISGQVTAFDQSIFKPVSIYQMETASPLYSLNNQTTTGGLYNTLLSDTRYALRQQLYYDANDNIKQLTKTNDMSMSIIWDYLHALPIAEIKNATPDQAAYTSFEADGSGSWSISSNARDTTNAITGRACYNLTNGSISRSGLSSTTNYLVSYWSRNGAYSVTGSTATVTGKTVNGWTYYEHGVASTTSVTITGSGSIDELRLYPRNAQMATSTYQPSVGKTSECDAGNRISYYIYDGFGRLKVVKDQDGNIVKTLEYHYQGQ